MSYNGNMDWVLIQTQTASSSANIDFTNISSDFAGFILTFNSVSPANNGDLLNMLVNTGGGFITTNYQSGINSYPYTTATRTNANSTTAFVLSSATANSSWGVNGMCWLLSMNNGATVSINGYSSSPDSSGGAMRLGTFCGMNTATNITSIRLQFSTGNIASGTFSLYGIRA